MFHNYISWRFNSISITIFSCFCRLLCYCLVRYGSYDRYDDIIQRQPRHQIERHEPISEDEIVDFTRIQDQLACISATAESLKLWIQTTVQE